MFVLTWFDVNNSIKSDLLIFFIYFFICTKDETELSE